MLSLLFRVDDRLPSILPPPTLWRLSEASIGPCISCDSMLLRRRDCPGVFLAAGDESLPRLHAAGPSRLSPAWFANPLCPRSLPPVPFDGLESLQVRLFACFLAVFSPFLSDRTGQFEFQKAIAREPFLALLS